MEIGDYENSQMVENWLLKSDIKNIEGSDDIIKAICGEDVSVNIAVINQFLMLIAMRLCAFAPLCFLGRCGEFGKKFEIELLPYLPAFVFVGKGAQLIAARWQQHKCGK